MPLQSIGDLRISNETLIANAMVRRLSMKNAYRKTYKVSTTFKAPLGFVYSWCTDYQEDDPKMVGSKNRRHLHEKTKERVIWTVDGKNLPSKTDPVRVVWLRPPNSWHLETCGDGIEIGDYKLSPVGKDNTRLDMTFTEIHNKKGDFQSKKEYRDETLDHWNKYGKFLERDFKASLSTSQ
jgi:hypothetical protein